MMSELFTPWIVLAFLVAASFMVSSVICHFIEKLEEEIRKTKEEVEDIFRSYFRRGLS